MVNDQQLEKVGEFKEQTLDSLLGEEFSHDSNYSKALVSDEAEEIIPTLKEINDVNRAIATDRVWKAQHEKFLATQQVPDWRPSETIDSIASSIGADLPSTLKPIHQVALNNGFLVGRIKAESTIRPIPIDELSEIASDLMGQEDREQVTAIIRGRVAEKLEARNDGVVEMITKSQAEVLAQADRIRKLADRLLDTDSESLARRGAKTVETLQASLVQVQDATSNIQQQADAQISIISQNPAGGMLLNQVDPLHKRVKNFKPAELTLKELGESINQLQTEKAVAQFQDPLKVGDYLNRISSLREEAEKQLDQYKTLSPGTAPLDNSDLRLLHDILAEGRNEPPILTEDDLSAPLNSEASLPTLIARIQKQSEFFQAIEAGDIPTQLREYATLLEKSAAEYNVDTLTGSTLDILTEELTAQTVIEWIRQSSVRSIQNLTTRIEEGVQKVQALTEAAENRMREILDGMMEDIVDEREELTEIQEVETQVGRPSTLPLPYIEPSPGIQIEETIGFADDTGDEEADFGISGGATLAPVMTDLAPDNAEYDIPKPADAIAPLGEIFETEQVKPTLSVLIATEFAEGRPEAPLLRYHTVIPGRATSIDGVELKTLFAGSISILNPNGLSINIDGNDSQNTVLGVSDGKTVRLQDKNYIVAIAPTVGTGSHQMMAVEISNDTYDILQGSDFDSRNGFATFTGLLASQLSHIRNADTRLAISASADGELLPGGRISTLSSGWETQNGEPITDEPLKVGTVASKSKALYLYTGTSLIPISSMMAEYLTPEKVSAFGNDTGAVFANLDKFTQSAIARRDAMRQPIQTPQIPTQRPLVTTVQPTSSLPIQDELRTLPRPATARPATIKSQQTASAGGQNPKLSVRQITEALEPNSGITPITSINSNQRPEIAAAKDQPITLNGREYRNSRQELTPGDIVTVGDKSSIVVQVGVQYFLINIPTSTTTPLRKEREALATALSKSSQLQDALAQKEKPQQSFIGRFFGRRS